MARWTENGLFVGSHKSEDFFLTSDTEGTKFELGTTKRKGLGRYAKMVKEKELFKPATSSSGRKIRVEKSASNLIFLDVTLKNNFGLLSVSDSSEQLSDLFPQSNVMGQAHLIPAKQLQGTRAHVNLNNEVGRYFNETGQDKRPMPLSNPP